MKTQNAIVKSVLIKLLCKEVKGACIHDNINDVLSYAHNQDILSITEYVELQSLYKEELHKSVGYIFGYNLLTPK